MNRSLGEEKIKPTGNIKQKMEKKKNIFTMVDVRLDQAGPYTVTATNPAGSASATANLKVIEKPKEILEPPEFVEVYEDMVSGQTYTCQYQFYFKSLSSNDNYNCDKSISYLLLH